MAVGFEASHGAPPQLAMPDGRHRLYGDLAFLWPLMSPPDEYRDEAHYWRRALRQRLGPGRLRILDLGAGGGHNLHHLAREFDATAVDLSEGMLAHSQRLNPGVAHHVGDMRTVRLGETFDAVLVHDAIAYMITEADLRAVFATARAHLRPGGLLIVAPDYYTETFVAPYVDHVTHRDAETELTYVEYSTDPDPTDTSIETVFVFFIRRGGELRVEVDRHTTGLFPMAAWERLLARSGVRRGAGRLPRRPGGPAALPLGGPPAVEAAALPPPGRYTPSTIMVLAMQHFARISPSFWYSGELTRQRSRS